MSPELRNVAFDSLRVLWENAAAMAPRLLAALLVFIVGWIAARMVRAVVRRGLKRLGLGPLSDKLGITAVLARLNTTRAPSEVVGQVAYWTILLVAFLSAADTLGLKQVSSTIDGVISYVPNVFASALVAVGGLALLGLLRRTTSSFLEGIGSESAAFGGKVVYVLGLVVVLGVAVAQLQIETRLFEIVAAIALASTGLGAALALGLGARRQASNILAGIYARDVYRSGERITFREHRGEVIEVSTTITRVQLDGGGGELRIPNDLLSAEAAVVSSAEGPS